MASFFNTIDLSGDYLSKANARAVAQENLVAAIFRQNKEISLSPSQLMTLVSAKYGRHCPLTSWRRALTNLTKQGTLVKTGQKVLGSYGLPEHTWAYNEAGDTKALETFFSDLQEGRLEHREKGSEVSPQPDATIRTDSPAHKGFIQQALFAY